MKIVLEFGVRGGWHADNIVLTGAKQASQIAAGLVNAYCNDDVHTSRNWMLKEDIPRISWQSSTHFVSLTRVNPDNLLGAASAYLWKVD